MEYNDTKRAQFVKNLEDWTAKVLRTYDSGLIADTYRMTVDIDKIISDAFDHDPVINQE